MYSVVSRTSLLIIHFKSSACLVLACLTAFLTYFFIHQYIFSLIQSNLFLDFWGIFDACYYYSNINKWKEGTDYPSIFSLINLTQQLKRMLVNYGFDLRVLFQFSTVSAYQRVFEADEMLTELVIHKPRDCSIDGIVL